MIYITRFLGPSREVSRLCKCVERQSLKVLFLPLLLLTIIINLNLIHNQNVILAHFQPDFRCSHVPPSPEKVNHIWLDSANFTPSDGVDNNPNQPGGFTIINNDNIDKADQVTSRARRYIESKAGGNLREVRTSTARSNSDGLPSLSIQDTLWSLIKRLEKPSPTSSPSSNYSRQEHQKSISSNHQSSYDELVPMKIQVYYDSSVHHLEKEKISAINETVIPSVVRFFEEVLLIKREYTIDRFRISRRCPNNTIYYAKDMGGLSRPYCMERCEDHAVCGEMIVPKEHLSACSYCNITSRRCTTNYSSEGKGAENTQLLLYVSAKQTSRCKRDQTIAYAAHCAQDTKTDRPVAGHANLCPYSIGTEPKDLEVLIATVKHELTHVLGFSVSLFAYYRDSNGQPLTERESAPGPIPVDPKTGYARWSDRVVRRVTRSNWTTGEGSIEKEAHIIVTPTVVREVRRHFNCSTLEGAELEDQGPDGTSMTHWEKRLFENEAMTGTHTQNSVYSRITLAALQDTGWYVANFSSAERLEWGKDLGCDFVTKSCKSWIDERRVKQVSIKPFCDIVKGDALKISCTEDRSSKAVCNMKHYKDPLPGVYQNFEQLEGTHGQDPSHFGGSVDLADYCPFIQEFTWQMQNMQVQNITVRNSRCDLGGNSFESEPNAALEYYGPDSRCFEHGRRWEQKSCSYRRHWQHFGAGCYRYTCTNGHVNVIVANQSYPCYYSGQIVSVEQSVDLWLYNGSIVCPSCDKICSPNKCMVYDSRLIDQIIDLSRLRQEPATQVTNKEKLLFTILDEYNNGIDTSGDVSSFNKYKSVLDELSRLINPPKAEETTTFFYAFEFKKTLLNSIHHPLVCSSATALSTNNHVVIVIVSLIMMVLSNILFKSTK